MSENLVEDCWSRFSFRYGDGSDDRLGSRRCENMHARSDRYGGKTIEKTMLRVQGLHAFRSSKASRRAPSGRAMWRFASAICLRACATGSRRCENAQEPTEGERTCARIRSLGKTGPRPGSRAAVPAPAAAVSGAARGTGKIHLAARTRKNLGPPRKPGPVWEKGLRRAAAGVPVVSHASMWCAWLLRTVRKISRGLG